MAAAAHDIARAAGERTREPRPHMNPYAAGFGLGLVLLPAFVLMGRGSQGH